MLPGVAAAVRARRVAHRRGTGARRRARVTVGRVLHPVGSLPPRVYWKRRLAGAGVVLLLLVVPILLITGGADSDAADVASTTAAEPAGTPQLDLIPAESLAPDATDSSSTSPSGSSTSPGTSSPPVTTGDPADAVVACGDDVIAVTAGSPQRRWSVTSAPVVTMAITNAGTVACTRDIGSSQQEWGLFDGGTRLWGSNDCQVEPGEDVQTLQPGQQVTVQIGWSGQTSEPTCQQPRQSLAPGEYQLRARLGSVQSTDFALTFT